MANKKAEILTMDGQVVSPITLATNVLLDDGRTAQDLLDSRDESMFSPTITTSSSISKVGQGDNVDFSENVIDGAYKSCVLKGKTLVNYNAEGNDRNEYVCMPSVEGSNLTVNDTVEGKVKSAILKGQTLVNLSEINKFSISGADTTVRTSANTLKPNTKYTRIVYITKNTLKGVNALGNVAQPQHGDIAGAYFHTGDNSDDIGEGFTGIAQKRLFTTPNVIVLNKICSSIRIFYTNTGGVLEGYEIIIEGDYTNVDIPYFEGMQSVKMPVLTTTGKNLFDYNGVEITSSLNYAEPPAINRKDCATTEIIENTIFQKDMEYYFKINDDSCKEIDDLTLYRITLLDENKKLLKIVSIEYGRKASIVFDIDFKYYRIGFRSPKMFGEGKSLIEDYGFTIDSLMISDTPIESFEPFKSNILTCNEEVTLRGIGDVKDTLDLTTGELTQRIGEVVLDGSDNFRYQYNLGIMQPNSIHVRILLDNIKDTARLTLLNDKLPLITPRQSWGQDDYDGIGISSGTGSNQGVDVRLWRKDLSTEDLNGVKEYLSNNPITVQYELTTESVKTVDLSDNVVYSYKDTTHYTCSSEDGSLLPTLTIEEGVKYKAIIKPSTKYSVVFNRTEVTSGLTVDLGGATANVVSATKGKTIVQITTPPTLSHNHVIFKGLGNVIKDVQVIEGDVADDIEYFEDMVDVKNPSVMNVGKNLYNGVNSVGFISDSTGIVNPAGVDWLVTDFVKVERNKTYTFSEASIFNGLKKVAIYDSDKNFLTMSNTLSFTPSENGYVRFNAKLTTGGNVADFVNQAQIQLEESSTPTAYEPYKSNTITTEQTDGSIITLRKVGDVSDTLDLMTGEYVQRIGEVVLDGSEEWEKRGNTNSFWTYNGLDNLHCVNSQTTINCLCDMMESKTFKYAFDSAAIPNSNVGVVGCTENKIAISFGSTTSKTLEQFKQELSLNPITVQYELETPITTTIDLKQHPYAYKDGYINLSSNAEKSLTPSIEYSLIANRLGQIQSNQKLVEKQQAQIDELESMVVANLVNTQYQQALNEIKLGVK